MTQNPVANVKWKENDAALQKETLRRHRCGLKVAGQQIVSLFLLTANPYGSLISLWGRNESCCNYSSLPSFFFFLSFCPFSQPFLHPHPPCSHSFSKKPMCLSLVHRSIMLSCYSNLWGRKLETIQKAGQDKDVIPIGDPQKHTRRTKMLLKLLYSLGVFSFIQEISLR